VFSTRSRFACLLVGVAAGASWSAAAAAPVTYDFTVGGGPTGPLAGVIATGWFTIDSSVIPVGGGLVTPGSPYRSFDDFSFNWNGIFYDETSDVRWAGLKFNSSGALSGIIFGNNCLVSLGCLLPGINGLDTWYARWWDSAPYFAYGTTGGPMALTLRANSVPVPTTLALLTVGLVAAVSSRKSTRR